MILAAHLPCYFPNLDFFYKLEKANVMVLADDLQYPKHGVVNRGKIKTSGGLDWLTVPVLTKGLGAQELRHVRINNQQQWRAKHWKTIRVNYSYGAYFGEHEDLLSNIYERHWSTLLELNLRLIEYFRDCLNIKTEVLLSSRLQIKAREKEWVFETMAKTGTKTYLAESSYANYLSTKMSQGVDLQFFDPRTPHYHQQFGEFLPGLSILDFVLNEGCHSLKTILAE